MMVNRQRPLSLSLPPLPPIMGGGWIREDGSMTAWFTERQRDNNWQQSRKIYRILLLRKCDGLD
jgi:hypothetical protein